METPTAEVRKGMLTFPCTYCFAPPEEGCYGIGGDPVYEVHAARVMAYRRSRAGNPPVAPPLPRAGS